MQIDPKKPSVFISYPHADEAIAKKLRDCLVTFGVQAILDQEIQAGEDFEADIAEFIKISRWFVLICDGEFDLKGKFRLGATTRPVNSGPICAPLHPRMTNCQ